ncbi:hypothetical protein [Neolewinella xylanilytica]|uniref:hypothetical protein n=1 Tax=Neolewinella xylanilytica TaxID=1514080 RepID=UPI0011AFD3B3|nr:hypothetical protein [Neolewinella xylanilytica]
MVTLYLTFGTDLTVHQQAVFSAMTLLAHRPGEIVVWTDAPHFYQFLGDRVSTRYLEPDTLAEWKGAHDFFWRIKIAALRQLSTEYPGEHLLYLDADTFCFAPPAKMVGILDNGVHLMHALEGLPSALPTSTERRMGRQTQGKTFGGVSLTDHHFMYNAGVVGLSAHLAGEAVDLALRICDEMCAAGVTRRLVEQYALSIALAEAGGLTVANSVIGHYWGNKREWTDRIGTFFLGHHLLGTSAEEQITATQGVDFRAFPLYRKSSSTLRKLQAWLAAKTVGYPSTYAPPEGMDASERSERWMASR